MGETEIKMGFFAVLRKHKVAIAVCAAVNTGSMLFGFDTGIAGAVIALGSFKSEFNLSLSPDEFAAASSNVVAVLNAGAFFGAFIPPLLGNHLGRKHMLALAGTWLMIGGILQTAAQGPTLGMVYAGRVVSGLGIGQVSNIAPVFAAECAPKELRGVMVGFGK